ncbi:hypothetical protein CRM93_06820 [Acetobacter fabarum]|uniref:Uncharacterized protein n=2 Tax=Acetobacter fabarum TaxID=483199 RepID=A0A269Y2F0_9PROT|nr:hypothetical protein B8X00_03055 [Acetobacter fabarum]PEN26985.1 hypothetical protein CRM93_06820 [Acetobacter fabarum]
MRENPVDSFVEGRSTHMFHRLSAFVPYFASLWAVWWGMGSHFIKTMPVRRRSGLVLPALVWGVPRPARNPLEQIFLLCV